MATKQRKRLRGKVKIPGVEKPIWVSAFTRSELEEKKRIVRKSGIIEIVDTDVRFEDVGGLQRLQNDLKVKSRIFSNLGDAVKYNMLKLLNEKLQKDDVVLIKASNYMKFTEICEAIC